MASVSGWLAVGAGGCDADSTGSEVGETGAGAGSASGTEAEAGATGDEAGEPEVDARAVAQLVAQYETFVRLTQRPISSAHGLADTIHVWARSSDVESYEAASAGDPVDFAEGALIVKEQFDADGALSSLTVMYKGPQGYAPEAGDWWWGFFGADLSLQNGGRIGACIDCHQRAEASDWIYGLEN